MGPGVEPGVAAAHYLNRELSLLEIKTIQVGNLQFSARRGFKALGKRNDLPVVEIETCNRVVGSGMFGLFFKGKDLSCGVKFGHAVSLRVVYMVGEYAGSRLPLAGIVKEMMKVVPVEYVVSQYQRASVLTNKVVANDEGLRQAIRAGLNGVLEAETPLAAVAKKLLKARGVLRCGNNKYVSYPSQHEGAERVVDHRFVEYRQQLF